MFRGDRPGTRGSASTAGPCDVPRRSESRQAGHTMCAVDIVADLAVGAVALLHAYILVLEMFLWTKPAGRRAFGTDAEFARASAPLAANQGLYNGFLAAGLIWGLLAGGQVGFQAKVFFLSCVLVAGIYGAATVNRRILVVQAVPAAVALVLVMVAR